jgi:ATP-dependent helicase/DNAse subunit B
LQADPVFRQAIAAHGIELNRANNQPPDEYGGVVGIPFDYRNYQFSVSQLTQLGQCPFKWFASKILRLNALEEPDDQLDAGWRGRLYHKVLELALIAYQQQSELDLTDTTQLLQWFKEAEASLQFPNLPTWESQRQEHIQILQRAIAQPSFLSADTTVLALEQKITGEWQGLPITGYIDRIDQTAQGLVVMDYKTSSTAPKGIKDETGKACLDLQLPIYKAVVADLYPDQAGTETRTLYYSLTKGEDISPKKATPEDALIAAGDRLKQHLKSGSYPVEPDLGREACRYCDFDSVCRKTEEEEE